VEVVAGVDNNDSVIENPSDSLTSGVAVHVAEPPANQGANEVEIVGYRFERLSWMSARASRKRASAAFSVWLDGLTCSSSAFNSALPKMPHQSARILSSPGCACCQPLLSLNSAGGCSL
jgi:hypothetical protein